ncbi:hypothetical protein PFUGPA_06020 [Plasmodium falciparum Palo Alto/Uganda]|uniref:Erythrocyte membrane protein 1 n=1 Tax=Plasmodium falciparum (isolate Palo Alto / Uganda) TaxID=57270 RepID=W4IRN0_PLAFP|nr:hypothetical protein PFUGPA_06020 [Plasmodium falciparum Palo Alto/Uganda]
MLISLMIRILHFHVQNIVEHVLSQKNILQKYKKFCENSEKNSQINNWECHYEKNDKGDGNGDINNCILGEWKTFTGEQDVKSYDVFFYGSIIDMLNESIEWREKLNSCINNKTGKCKYQKCKEYCECYRRWIDKKKTEWDKIKDHFDTQEGFDILGNNYDWALKMLLNVTFLQDIKDAYPYEQQLQKIEKLLQNKMQDDFNFERPQTSIDEFLQEEERFAETCKNCQPPTKPASKPEDLARSLNPLSPADASPPDPSPPEDGSQSPAQEEEEDEEDLDEVEEEGETHTEDTEGDRQGPKEGEEPPKVEDICKIVGDALTSGKLDEACTLKYVTGKNYGWKCVSSGGADNSTTKPGSETAHSRTARSAPETATSSSGKPTSDKGSICVPPRRRKLYVGHLQKWADNSGNDTQVSGETTQGGAASQAQSSSSSSTTPPSNSRDVGLLAAFVESAAVETFFLWDRYKKLNTKNKGETQGGGNGDDENNPQDQLQRGDIPEEFKRQMFYTLGDYRDILFSGIKDEKSGDTDIFTGDKDIQERESKIKEAIKKFFEQTRGGPQPQPNSVTTPKDWWQKNGEHIWEGMVCALTYTEKKDTSEGTNKIVKDEEVYNKFFGSTPGKPGTTGTSNGTQKGTYKEKYDYNSVKLDNSDTQAKTKDAPNSQPPSSSGDDPINNPKLSDFVLRPPYFRYLEEWGQNFCKERKKRLDQIYIECKVGQGRGKKENPKCSCYGEDCDDQLDADPTNVSDLKCPSCAISCKSYKKWIKTKKNEFEKQQKAYKEQRTNYTIKNEGAESTDHDKKFCGTLEENAAEFLQKLGPCSKTNNNVEEDNGEDKTDFRQPEKTFKEAHNCAPCSEFKIDCKKHRCDSTKGDGCNAKNRITAENIKNCTEDIGMLVSDESTAGFYDLSVCRGAGIFQGIKENKWECGNFCGYVVCKPKTSDGEKGNENQIIIIRALVKRWLEYFFKDYNKIRKKLKSCMNSSDATPCIKGCAEEWLKTKKAEWGKIKDRFNEQYKDKDKDKDQEDYNVKTVLEKFYGRPEFKNAIKPCGDLDQFQNSTDCAVDASSEKENGKKRDVVVCLIEKLEKEAEKCKEDQKPNGEKQANCGEYTPPDEEDLLLEEEENTVKAPKICENVLKTKTPEEKEGGCVPATTKPKETSPPADSHPAGPAPGPQSETKSSEEPAKIVPEKKVPAAPSPAPTPRKPPRPQRTPDLLDNPHVKTALVTSTLAWSVGIGFAAFTYFYLKVNGILLKHGMNSKGIQNGFYNNKYILSAQKNSAFFSTEKSQDLSSLSKEQIEEKILTVLKKYLPPDVEIKYDEELEKYNTKDNRAWDFLDTVEFLIDTKQLTILKHVINIPKSDYDIPTKLSPNRYIPYTSGKYRGKRYIYLEGDSGTDSGYTDHYSDITSSSESEYEEMDINDIYVPGSPKYKTLIEVVLEPSGNNTTASGNNTTASGNNTTASGNNTTASGKNTPSDNTPTNKFTDNEWNTLKHDFITNMLQNEPNDVPNDYKSGNSSTNTNITTTSRHNMEEKPFIMSIHDRNLYTGEEIKYNINMSTNSMDDIPINRDNNIYSGIDLINDALNGDYDIYDELLKRKENELFGTEHHPKRTTTNHFATPTRDDPIHNQLELFHKWLDRHRDMCEKWENHHERLAKLKEEWENDTSTSGNTHPSDSNKTLNTDVSIQIHMDNPKPINQFTNMDTILEDLEKYKEPYYDVQDDIYYDVHDHDTSTVDSNNMNIPSKVQIEMDVNTKLVKEKYPIADVWDI